MLLFGTIYAEVQLSNPRAALSTFVFQTFPHLHVTPNAFRKQYAFYCNFMSKNQNRIEISSLVTKSLLESSFFHQDIKTILFLFATPILLNRATCPFPPIKRWTGKCLRTFSRWWCQIALTPHCDHITLRPAFQKRGLLSPCAFVGSFSSSALRWCDGHLFLPLKAAEIRSKLCFPLSCPCYYWNSKQRLFADMKICPISE